MRRSTHRILSTHVGRLQAMAGLRADDPEYGPKLRDAVAAVVDKQRTIGIDIVNEGEFTKSGDWLSYIEERLGGFEARAPSAEKPIIAQGKDREEFADFYRYAA